MTRTIDIVRLDIADSNTASAVLELQRRAYRVEADLIGSDGIPPLWETLDEVRACGEEFLGAVLDGGLAGAISWRFDEGTLDIHRLVVDPDRFRRGIATKLVQPVLEAEAAAQRAIVQTGADNAPAIALYLREGFEHVGEVEVGDGLRISQLAKQLR
jgi:ribosomal protein S18 acetylase RimI-like enzyme